MAILKHRPSAAPRNEAEEEVMTGEIGDIFTGTRKETDTEPAGEAGTGNTVLEFTGRNILTGIIFSEILGKPMALRKRRPGLIHRN